MEYQTSGMLTRAEADRIIDSLYDDSLFTYPTLKFGNQPRPCRAQRDAERERYENERCSECGTHPDDYV